MSLRSRVLRAGLVVGLVLVLGLLALPGRLWIGQREAIADAQAQLGDAKLENRKLKSRVEELSSDELVEREAREGFGWVYPGDELYTLTPSPPPIVALPDVWPFNRLQEPLAEVAATSNR